MAVEYDDAIAIVRKLWLSEDANALISGESDADFPVLAFQKIINRYLAGFVISASMLGDPSSKRPIFEMLRVHNEVWVFCCRIANRQYRLFGRFTAEGEFVVLFGRRRDQLVRGGYDKAAAEFIARWEAELGAFYQANSVEAYLGDGVFNVDDEVQ